MSDWVSLLQNRASSTSLVAAVWSGWASSQYGAKEEARPHLAKNGRHGPAMEQSRLEAPVGKPRFLRQGLPSAALAAAVSADAAFRRSKRRWLAARQIEDAHLPAVLDQPDDRAAHAQLGVIRMRRNNKCIKHVEFSLVDESDCRLELESDWHRILLSDG